jgi:Signal transduction histidine kinase
MKCCVFILFAVIVPQLVFAWESIHYTTMNGLSGIDVTAICENENFLWIATNDGLNRFDGKTFKTYRSDNTTRNSLTGNNIETLMFDSNGLLWIGLKTGGADIFNPRKNKFTHISEIVEDYPQRVISIYEDSRKNIWLGSWEEGLYQLTPTESGELSYRVAKHYPRNIVSSIVEKPAGKLWIGTYYGYFLYDIERKKDIELDGNHYAVTQFLDTGEKNALWFSTWEDGLCKVEWDEMFSVTVKKGVTKEPGDIYRIFPSSDNKLYLGTWGDGVKLADRQSHVSSQSLPINAPVILSFFRDRYDKLWIGTYGTGLYCLDDRHRGIDNLSPINRKKAAAYVLREFDNHHLLLGTQGDGLYLYNLKNRKFYSQSMKNTGSFFHQYILSLYKDDELLIAGNDDTGIQYAPLNEGSVDNLHFRTYYVDKNFGKVTSVFRSSDSIFWIGTKQFGLYSMKYDSANKTFTERIHYDSFGMDEITGFAETADNRIWVSSHKGIYLFNPMTKKIQKIERDISEMVYSLADDHKNKCLWLGTSGGLRKLDYSGEIRVESPFFTEMLPEGAIRDVITDAENNLWFSVSNRIFCYIDDSKELKEINLGAINTQILYSSARCRIGNKPFIVFGGADNLLFIDSQKVLNQPNHTKILLTELQVDYQVVKVGQKVYGKVVLDEATEYARSITLSHLCKWISLSFTEIGWDNYHNSYQYRIEGFTEDWQYLDLSKPITFSQLPPGNYTLLIRPTAMAFDSRNETFWSLDIAVTPPWWKTNLFYFVLAITVLLLLAGLFFMIKNHYKRRQAYRLREMEKRKKEELLQEKESFFTGLSHDLLTSFSLILAPASDLLRDKDMNEEQKEKLDIISKNADFLSDIFGTILDFKRAELTDREVKEKTVELVAFIRIIVNAFDYLAKSGGISLSYHSEVSSLAVVIDTVKLERILYNLISNALKFTGEGGTVDIILSYTESSKYFSIQVKDTGIGIEYQNQSKIFEKFYREDESNNSRGLGLGLYTTRKFLQVMGGDITIDSVPRKGTAITVTFPARQVEIIPDKEEQGTDNNIFTVLLVEDNIQMQEYLRKKLSAHFNVAVASNGVEALEFIKNNLPELVISDVMMPEMDGLALCSTVKNTSMYSDIFVILLSAKSSSEDEVLGYKAGADFYLKKPFDPDILINQMKNVYATRQQRRKQIISDLLSPQEENTELHPKNDFLNKAIKIIEEHIMDEDFKIDEFAAEMNLSKTILHRKFKLMIGETPNVFIRNIRLRKASNMLKTTNLSISEIAYMTGFSQAHYFIKCFKELYQDTPKNFRMRNKPEEKE